MNLRPTTAAVQTEKGSTQHVNNRVIDRQEIGWSGESTSFERADDIEGVVVATERQAGNVDGSNETLQRHTNT